MMDPIVRLFGDLVRKVKLNPPQIPWISCLSGDWVTATLATDPNYWTQQLRQPVLFANGVQKLLKDPDLTFLEVGPGKSLSNFVKQNPAKRAGQLVLTSLQGDQNSSLDTQSMLGSLGQLWLAGARVAWGPLHGNERRHRVPLPTYPFERGRFWIGAPNPGNQKVGGTAAAYKTESLNDREGEVEGGETAMEPNISRLAVFGQRTELQSKLQTLFSELSGLERAALEVSASFMELGFDSLFLTQASSAIQQRFNVKVSFRQLLEGQSTIESLAAYLDQILPREEKAKRTNLVAARKGSGDEMQAKEPVVTSRNLHDSTNGQTTQAIEGSSNLLERILNKQIELMSRSANRVPSRRRSIVAGTRRVASEWRVCRIFNSLR
jgi:acyl transferase domain-containing protein